MFFGHKNLGTTIGSWQEKMLNKMLKQKKGAIHSLMDLHGKAWLYKSRYEWHLENAVRKYNSAVIKNKNISNDYLIKLGKFGPRGGHGFKVIPRAFL